MSLIEALEAAAARHCKQDPLWNDARTVETISEAILESIANAKQVVGSNSADKPREIMLGRAYGSDLNFKYALDDFSQQIMKLFPNLPNERESSESQDKPSSVSVMEEEAFKPDHVSV